jgi:hypothetical protein
MHARAEVERRTGQRRVHAAGIWRRVRRTHLMREAISLMREAIRAAISMWRRVRRTHLMREAIKSAISMWRTHREEGGKQFDEGGNQVGNQHVAHSRRETASRHVRKHARGRPCPRPT